MRCRQLAYQVVLAILVTSGWLYGQATGSLVGTVRDSSGAVVPGTKVVATHNGTGIPYEKSTNASGDYVFPSLPLGTYTLTFNLKSFQEVRVEKIEIHVATTIRQDATLSPAAVATKVQVIASTPMVKTETSEIGQLVGSSQITDLPLNGRNAYSLLHLTAGTETGLAPSSGYGANSLTRPAVAGGRGGYTVFRLDSQNVSLQNFAAAGVQPNVDALEEFRAITQLAPASESSSSSVSVATKSGTNRFHGTAYDFLRNNVLDAHAYFTKQISVPQYTYMKDQLRYNQFGGSLGGPIKKEKTFFFASVQLTRQRTLSQTRQILPTAQMLQGDFSGTNPITRKNFAAVADPQYWYLWPTNVPFSENKVPSTRWSSFAKAFLPIAFLPANCMDCLAAGLGFNFVGSLPGSTNNDQYLGRIDHRFSEKDTLFGNFQVSANPIKSTTLPIPVSGKESDSRSVSVGLNETHIFSPALVNEFRAGYLAVLGGFQEANLGPSPFTFKNTPTSLPYLYPTVLIGSYPGFGSNTSLLSSHNGTTEELWDFSDSLTYMRGNHQLKTGFELMRAHFGHLVNQNAVFLYVDGFPTIYGYSTNAFADFLLGTPLVGLTSQGTGKAPMVERSVYAGYVQDAWKIHPRLTLNFGMRYEFAQAWHDLNTALNRLGTLDVSPAGRALGGRFLMAGSADYYVPGQGVIKGTGAPLIRGDLIDPAYKDFQPRIGFAYRPFNNNKTAIRGGFGVYFAMQDANSLAFEMSSPPFQYAALFVNAYPNVPLGAPMHDADFFLPAGPGGTATDGDDPHNRDPRVYEWTLSVQHQLSNSLLFSVEYLGNHGIKNPVGIAITQPPLPNAAQLAALKANPASDTTAAIARSPFPNLPAGFEYIENVGNSWYEALNLKAEGRFGKRLNFSAVYTWSKALDVGSYELQYLITLAGPTKSYADFDHPHRFVASGVYNLPFGDTMLVPKSRVLKKFAAGWEVSGIATFEAGPPFSVTMGADTSFLGGCCATFPNLSGPLVYRDIRASGGIYLTQQNFVAPPFGQLGTLARHAFHGPGLNNFDLGLMKNMALTENTRVQFRAEMFNAFNHPQFSIGDQALASSISAPPAGSTEPVITYVNPANFGRVGARGSRVVQFAIKLIW